MTIPKQEVLELLHQFSDEVDVEDLIHRLYLREKLAVAPQVEAQLRANREKIRARLSRQQTTSN